jgi:ferredoxin
MISCDCINCSACEFECPVRAIAPGPSQFAIDPATCVECDGYFTVPRCKSVCPVGACSPSREGYLVKMRALANRGAEPLLLRADAVAKAAT